MHIKIIGLKLKKQ